jgi:hypothetical protein
LVILGKGLLAEASRRDFAAVSTDDPAGYRIKDTSTGNEPAADESAADLPELLITQKAGADPAKHALCFLQVRHATLLFLSYWKAIISRGEESRIERKNRANESRYKPNRFRASAARDDRAKPRYEAKARYESARTSARPLGRCVIKSVPLPPATMSSS